MICPKCKSIKIKLLSVGGGGYDYGEKPFVEINWSCKRCSHKFTTGNKED
jgi:ribosomal protein L37AE/L43A